MMQSSQAFDGAKLVVVAGGRCESVTMDTTDILNLETNSWIEGTYLCQLKIHEFKETFRSCTL